MDSCDYSKDAIGPVELNVEFGGRNPNGNGRVSHSHRTSNVLIFLASISRRLASLSSLLSFFLGHRWAGRCRACVVIDPTLFCSFCLLLALASAFGRHHHRSSRQVLLFLMLDGYIDLFRIQKQTAKDPSSFQLCTDCLCVARVV